MGSNLGAIHLAFSLVSFSSLSVFGQWFPVDSGTTNNLNGAYLLDSGTGFVVGDGGTILKTTDAGATWAPLRPGTARILYDVYLFNPDEGVAVGERGLILRTTDGGAAWQRVTSGVQDSLRSASFSGVNGICGGDSQTILYSADAGASWNIGQTGFFGGGFPGAHMVSPTRGFVAGQNSIFQPLVGTSRDGGASWAFQPFYFEGNEGGGNDIRFLDQNTGVVSGIVFDGRGAIARTTDGGLNWSTSFFDQGIEGIDFPTADTGFAVGWAGRILRTNDSGVTWNEQTSGTSANLNDVNFFGNALTGIAVGEGGIILRTTNGGEPSPTPTPTPSPSPSCSPPCYLPVVLSESFDGVTPPALPPDWEATNAQGPPPLWVTSSSGVPIPPADSPPNAAFIDNPAVVSDKRLDWLPFNFFEVLSARLTFRHNFNLEASDADPNLGFDGGVLELSTDGGNTFQDILAAGGSFAIGGYNRTISTNRGSPIAGRQAWSGNSEGFVTTVVNLPIFIPPGSRLRWRMASDTSGSHEGWRVDTVNIAGCAPVPCPTPTPTPTPPPPTPTPTPTATPTPTTTPTATPSVTPPPRPSPGPSATPHASPPPRPEP